MQIVLKSFLALLLTSSFIVSPTFAAEKMAKPVSEPAAPASAEQTVKNVCSACHGADGNSAIALNPKLAGQHPEYLLKQLTNFKEGKRANAVMSGIAGALSTAEMQDLAKYFADQKQTLGKAKSNPEESEPAIRDADMVSIHLSALKFSDAPAQNSISPSGFTIEESCQLARYAGMSDKLTSFGIFGFQSQVDGMALTAESAALLLWYFLEGFYNRKADYPISAAFNQLTQYLVDVKTMQQRISFWRSNKSGRWWMEMPVKSKKKLERHRLVSCSYNDYLSACNDDISERLMNAYRKFI